MRITFCSMTMCVVAPARPADFDVTYSGRYVWGHEVNSLRPCDSEDVYWVSASSRVLEPLLELYRSRTDEPYQPIFIEFRGHLPDEVFDGLAADYDGLVRISEVLNRAEEVPRLASGKQRVAAVTAIGCGFNCWLQGRR